MAVRSADAVRAGIAAANDHHMLASGRDTAVRCGAELVIPCHPLILLGQEIHGEMDATKLPAFDQEVSGNLGSAGHDQDLVVIHQALDGDVDANLEAGAKDDPLGLHLLNPAVDDVLFHLEVRNAVAEQAADPVALLEDCHGVPGPGQLLGTSESRRTRAHHGDPLARAARRHLRGDPAFFPTPVDDLAFDRLDGDRRILDVQGARRLTGCRADAAGELREIVGGQQIVQGGLPLLAVDEVVEVRDLVVHRATVVTERNPTIHAAGRLIHQFGGRQRVHELAVVAKPLLGRLVVAVAPGDFKKSCRLSHVLAPYSAATAAPARWAAAMSVRARR